MSRQKCRLCCEGRVYPVVSTEALQTLTLQGLKLEREGIGDLTESKNPMGWQKGACVDIEISMESGRSHWGE
jgi:hypothetical protein